MAALLLLVCRTVSRNCPSLVMGVSDDKQRHGDSSYPSSYTSASYTSYSTWSLKSLPVLRLRKRWVHTSFRGQNMGILADSVRITSIPNRLLCRWTIWQYPRRKLLSSGDPFRGSLWCARCRRELSSCPRSSLADGENACVAVDLMLHWKYEERPKLKACSLLFSPCD
jgi:hypothetical protein